MIKIKIKKPFKLEDTITCGQIFRFFKMEDGSFISEIDMPESEWTLYYISTFGPYCEILEPNELRDKFKDYLQKTLSIYK